MPKKRATLDELNRKLDRVLSTQRKMTDNQEDIERSTKKVARDEKAELEALEDIKKFEEKLKKAVGPHPLRKMTYKDIAKGSIGAFFGIGAHFTFYYSVKIAAHLSFSRAFMTFILAYVIGGIFMYFTGFRKIRVKKVIWFLPFRLTILYITAIATAFFVLVFFEPHFLHSFDESFKQLATTTLSATIGACTADLIGRE